MAGVAGGMIGHAIGGAIGGMMGGGAQENGALEQGNPEAQANMANVDPIAEDNAQWAAQEPPKEESFFGLGTMALLAGVGALGFAAARFGARGAVARPATKEGIKSILKK